LAFDIARWLGQMPDKFRIFKNFQNLAGQSCNVPNTQKHSGGQWETVIEHHFQ
jgi:hypothetical protein